MHISPKVFDSSINCSYSVLSLELDVFLTKMNLGKVDVWFQIIEVVQRVVMVPGEKLVIILCNLVVQVGTVLVVVSSMLDQLGHL